MAAKYDFKPMPHAKGDDKPQLMYPRIVNKGTIDTERLGSDISHMSSFTPGDIKGLVKALADEMACQMASGRSVKIDGIGVFSPSLALRDGYERESGEPGAPKRNAMSIWLNNVNFRADKELIENTGRRCILERSKWKFRHSSQVFSPQERLKMAQDFLCSNPFMRVADYCRLTGLLSDKAARELKQWSEEPESGIGCKGRGSHKIYVKR